MFVCFPPSLPLFLLSFLSFFLFLFCSPLLWKSNCSSIICYCSYIELLLNLVNCQLAILEWAVNEFSVFTDLILSLITYYTVFISLAILQIVNDSAHSIFLFKIVLGILSPLPYKFLNIVSMYKISCGLLIENALNLYQFEDI